VGTEDDDAIALAGADISPNKDERAPDTAVNRILLVFVPWRIRGVISSRGYGEGTCILANEKISKFKIPAGREVEILESCLESYKISTFGKDTCR
jgi:hypothetical protein